MSSKFVPWHLLCIFTNNKRVIGVQEHVFIAVCASLSHCYAQRVSSMHQGQQDMRQRQGGACTSAGGS
jgi:hypothetical protein